MEDYYQGASSIAVPFIWESQPGTPKIKFRENPVPPLTPPPSYFYNTPKRTTKKNYSKPNNNINLFNNIFSKRTSTRKSSLPVSPASSSSSSSSLSSSSSSFSCSVKSSPRVTVISRSRVRYGISSPRKSFDSRMMMEDKEENECKSPVSTLCFGIGRGANGYGRSRGCYASMIKVLLRDV